MSIVKWIQTVFCKHETYDIYEPVLGWRYRKCKDCKLEEDEKTLTKDGIPFKIIGVNN